MEIRFTSALLRLCLLVAAAASLYGPGLPAGDVIVRVTESGRPLPCRLTLLDERGNLAEFTPEKRAGQAYRKGVLYTASGEARIAIPPGSYTLYANRGMEYGLSERRLSVGEGVTEVRIALDREVDTRGYVSVDSHIHTLTHSGHGDATIEERMATIAGEGIELAIATDHNHHTDYRPHSHAAGTDAHFTSVIGNEVTTSVGHFNAFPVEPGAAVPDYRSGDWKQLLAGIRAVPGVKVVVLNHPSNLHSGFKPTDPSRFHPESGESHDGREWDFDGIEVVTSAALQSDVMKPLRDWFAVLNSGRRMTGIGSSDTHEVNAYILGQGRTYVASRDDRPDAIDVQEVCDNLKAGRALISLGLFTEAWIGGRSAGEMVSPAAAEIPVRIRVQGPRWVQADRLELFANGSKVVTRPIVSRPDAVVKMEGVIRIPRPRQDVWLVAVATGPGIEKPWWPIPRPYQPASATWEPRVLGATNPIWIDADGDGRFTSAAGYARKAVESCGEDPAALVKALAEYDASVTVQAAALCRARGWNLRTARVSQAFEGGAPHVRQAFAAYLNNLPQGAAR